MAASHGEAHGKFPQDDIVSKIVKDAKQPPNALMLTGYVGHSSEPKHVRLYLDTQFGDYVEIPEDSVLHIQEIPKATSPLGGSYVWINRDAEVIHGKVGTERPKAKFLEGRIQQDYLRAAAQPAILPQTSIPVCGTALPFLCPPPHTVDVCPPHHTIGGLPCPPPPTPHCTVPPQCPPHTPLNGCPPPTVPPQCPPATVPPQCPPHTPLNGCPPPVTTHCTVVPQCPPHTPLHGCPPPTTNGATALPCCHTLLQAAACPLPTHVIACAQLSTSYPEACPAQTIQCPTSLQCPSVHVLCPPHTPLHGCPPHTVPPQCPIHTPACPTVFACPSVQIVCPPTPHCPTHNVLCPPTRLCPSEVVICPPTRYCPSALACPSVGACPSIACTVPGQGGFGGGGFLGA